MGKEDEIGTPSEFLLRKQYQITHRYSPALQNYFKKDQLNLSKNTFET